MNHLGRIAVLARHQYAFDDQDEQIEQLTEFMNDLGEDEVDYVTSDPDYGLDRLTHYAEDLDLDYLVRSSDSYLTDAIKEARDQGHDDDNIVQTLLDNAEYDTFGTYPSGDALFYSTIGEIELYLDNQISGQVNGVEVDDVWSALKEGLDEDQIWTACRHCNWPVTRSGSIVINLDNQGWQAVPDLDAFRAALEPVDGLSAFERPPTLDHGGHTKQQPRGAKGGEVEPVATPVPHAKEQLLRHLLRYAR